MTILAAMLFTTPLASAARTIGVPINFVTTAPFPEGLVVSPDGNLVVSRVAFASTSSILVFSPHGDLLHEIAITAGPSGLADLVGDAFDAAGNLYVADFADALSRGACCHGRILKITSTGDISTFASGFYFPNGLAFDQAGNLYASDSFAGKISKVTPDGTVSVFLADDHLLAHNPGTNPPFGVNGIAFTRDRSTMMAVNTIDGTVLAIPIGGDGEAGTPFVLASGFFGADGIALDVKGNLYIAENFQQKIVVLRPDGSLLATYFGTGDNVLRNPASLAFLGRRLFITDLSALITPPAPGLSVLTAQYPGTPLLDDPD